jgi:hypothetical protein
VEDAIPFSFLLVASAPATTSTSAAAPSTPASAPWFECGGLGGLGV